MVGSPVMLFGQQRNGLITVVSCGTNLATLNPSLIGGKYVFWEGFSPISILGSAITPWRTSVGPKSRKEGEGWFSVRSTWSSP